MLNIIDTNRRQMIRTKMRK